MQRISISFAKKEFVSANILSVAVGSNCPQGGDTGHGGRTYLAIENEASTDMRVIVDGQEFEHADKIELIFGGDTEHATFIDALEFALAHLKKERPLSDSTGVVEISY